MRSYNCLNNKIIKSFQLDTKLTTIITIIQHFLEAIDNTMKILFL